jgi:acyl transferase domain-containing protein
MDKIAIIGIGCKFPKAINSQHFWENLYTGIDAISIKTQNSTPNISNESIGGYVENYDQFDSKYFNISPREAKCMDPQQRIMLDVAQQSFQDANINAKDLASSKTGVFIGVMGSDWNRLTLSNTNNIELHTGTGNGYCMIANRVSYVYDLRGPSMAIDTACSSSLVAIDTGCKYLKLNEINLAIVGGVNSILTPALDAFYQKAGLASKSGRCKSFGSNADGIVRGEGAGVVLLKRLSDAIQDNDRIYAVIHGSAVNHDGRSNGITAPNKWAQIQVIKSALENAGKQPYEVQYVEGHGTGTLLGDPIEASALGEAIGKYKKSPCIIGSVKSNLGHLEGAAGIAGVIKVALSIHHQKIPPSLHYGSGNPYINFRELNLHVQTKLTDWVDKIKIAGISSFGLGGTNSHIVLGNHNPDKVDNQLKKSVGTTVENQEKLQTQSTLINLISSVTELSCDQIGPSSNLIHNLGFDSLMMLELKEKIEKQFSIKDKFEINEFFHLETVESIVGHINKILNLI